MRILLLVLLLLSLCLTATIITLQISASDHEAKTSIVSLRIINIVPSSFDNDEKKNGHHHRAHKTNPTYASFNIDGSYKNGLFFQINFTNPNLIAATTSLAPFTVRFGGTGNDYLSYDCRQTETTIPGSQKEDYSDDDYYSCLNSTHRTNLLDLVSKSGGKFLFGVSFDMVSACDNSKPPSSYIWNASNFSRLVQQMKDSGQTVWGFELGNELNNRAQGGNENCGGATAQSGGLIPSQQADAINLMAETINSLYPNPDESRPVIIGPDTGYYKPDYWLNGTLSLIGPKLYAVTHHVYPGINRQNYNDAKTLDRVLHDISWYVPMTRQYAPQAQIWAGENGPAAAGKSGTCGPDDVSICGLYGSILWYADDMALRALHGFSQYQRQDLIGARYSLIGIQHDNQALSATAPVQLHPDFWINFLWKRVVGTTVLNVTTTTILQPPQQESVAAAAKQQLRVYGFMGEPPNKFSIPSDGNSITLIVINLDNVTTAQLSIEDDDVASTASWMLSPESESAGLTATSTGGGGGSGGGPFGSRIELNGVLLPVDISNGQSIDNIPVGALITNGNIISVDPISVAFVRLHRNKRIMDSWGKSESL